MSSPSITTTPFPPSRDDNAVKLRRQEAANALQRYPVLALHAVRNGESPAMMRLKLMSMMSNRPLQPSHATVKYKKGGVARASSSSDAS
ncbi:predicted protein [Lichtheimia corymbifera JMRC:FSU:9682]|uniref:Uncharacterized protein n=1 Tax=Lichtheimia corymbifera JMRC:FSU:9682 TaxID=1263082 RepID=A0A068SHH6_9FUNG|nr:predicted protein [Lichtheimia corymbifera JMRC:FSU:9682]